MPKSGTCIHGATIVTSSATQLNKLMQVCLFFVVDGKLVWISIYELGVGFEMWRVMIGSHRNGDLSEGVGNMD